MALADEDQDAPLDPAAERLRRKLVRLLLVSGGVMALGFIAVFAAIVYRLGALGPDAAGSGELVEAAIPTPPGARLLTADLDGERALLFMEGPDGAEALLLIDLSSGRVLGRYALAEDR